LAAGAFASMAIPAQVGGHTDGVDQMINPPASERYHWPEFDSPEKYDAEMARLSAWYNKIAGNRLAAVVLQRMSVLRAERENRFGQQENLRRP